MLVLARQESVDGLEDVRKENLQLLQEMHNVGLKWVEKFQNEDASLIFRLGYHSVSHILCTQIIEILASLCMDLFIISESRFKSAL